MPTALVQFLAVALAYAFSGWLSLLLALPPGYTAPFFPPAGIALAVVLVYGPRTLPGIWLGAVGVHLISGHLSGIAPVNLPGVVLAALSAPTQAFVGLLLARKLVGWPDPLERPRTISRFLGLVAPLSCLTSVSIALPILVYSGVLPAYDTLFNWWNWWLGDTFGVLIITPILLTFLARPRDEWRGRRVLVAVPTLVCLGVVTYVFAQIRQWDDRRVLENFCRETDNIANLVKSRLNAQLDMVNAVASWADTTPRPSRDLFLQYVRPFLARYPGTQNFGWAPLVTHGERSAIERDNARALPGFHFLGRDRDGKVFPAAEAREYLPLLYLEPRESNRRAFGLDILNLAATARTVARTRASGEIAASEPFRLVQEKGEQRGVVIYKAVFDGKPNGDAPPILKGIVSSALRMDDAILATLPGSSHNNVRLCFVDEAASPDHRRLYGRPGCEYALAPVPALRVRTEIPIAGRNWTLIQDPTPAFITAHRSWTAWLALAAGLGAVGLLGAFMLVTTGNTRRISNLVLQRTTELAEAQRMARLGSWEWVSRERTLWISDELENLLGELPLDIDLEGLINLFNARDQLSLREAIASVQRSAQIVSLDARPIPGPGRVDVVHVQIESQWIDGELFGLRGTIQDVSAARAAEAHIHHLAHYDALTGLPNRSLWMSRARAAVAAATRHNEQLAVLFLDLDQFKTVNDSLGHAAGDRLLTAIAHRLQNCLREEDLLARLGGDEFVILMERVDSPDDAGAVARKILETVAQPLTLDENELVPKVSIGVALFPADGQDLDTLLKQADVAMYGAKDAGRNGFKYFRPEMTERVSDKLTLENALRRGIERNELVVHYQPQVAPLDGWIVGAEALVRWNRPERGLVPPDQFIPAAEESGLIVALGEWVMAEVFRQQVALREMGFDEIQLAVNVSASQLLRPDFSDKVLRLIEETGANPECIELEITESAVVEASPDLVASLERLRNQGITLALDDFGTGYSCLAYLKRLPISRLKIDRSFVRDIPGDPEDAAITMATLSLARDLGMDTVAEGVETVDQQHFLMQRGCECMQGYLFHRPMPAEQFVSLLAKQG